MVSTNRDVNVHIVVIQYQRNSVITGPTLCESEKSSMYSSELNLNTR